MHTLLVCFLLTAAPPTEGLSIEQLDGPRRIQVRLRLTGKQRAELKVSGGPTSKDLERYLHLALCDEHGQPGPAIFARYELTDHELVLRPRYALIRGGHYVAAAKLPGGTTFVKRYSVVGAASAADPPYVTSVYPSGNRLPANCLKFYVHFSQPIREGREIFDQIAILDDQGRAVPDPWRRTELWTADARRLTLWIHPGRIKQGVNLRQQLGPVLQPARDYQLVVSTAVRDAEGRRLVKSFVKSFRTHEEDRARPLPSKWRIHAPRRDTRDLLHVGFGEPIDRALLTRFLKVTASGDEIEGEIQIGTEERTWSFKPARAWRCAELKLQVDGRLEDVAGNTPVRVFDTDLTSKELRLPRLSLSIMLEAPPANGRFTESERSYWAFQRVHRPPIPAVRQRDWLRNPIDAFVLAKLESSGLRPAAQADRATLIRRATFDLIGLPPTPEEVSAFLEDRSPDAWSRVINRLLSSPHHGERWARHWLDAARFAESDGFETDLTRPNAWRIRDYVVDAFNSDKPYDRFVREQIAGDELWPENPQARIATGFNRHYPEEGNNKDLLLARQEILHDVTDTVGATFLGLTFNCARCHDHKFDPILQRDYYRLQAFFANMGHDDRVPLVTPSEAQAYENRLAVWRARTLPLWNEMDALLATVRKYSPAQLLARYPDYVIQAVELPAAERTPLQSQIVYLLNTKDCNTCPLKPEPFLDPNFKRDAGKLNGQAKERFDELQTELSELESLRPADLPRGSAILDISDQAPATHVLGVGLHTSPLEEVQPGFLSILDKRAAWVEAPSSLSSTGRRSALANWLADPNNPLTARVMVNRIWHHHFGRGIVATPGDFGNAGTQPTHPQLLDWLAHEFIRSGWSIKHIHRLIVTSSVYRQESIDRSDAGNSDPENRLFWRFPVQRLEAEAIRDAALSVSGLLNPQVGGPSVFPPLPPGQPRPVGGWRVSPDDSSQVRRSLYIFVRRNNRYPMLEVFDFPDTHEACACRNTTITAPQALALLNSPLVNQWADAFAQRVVREVGSARSDFVKRAYQLAYSREPDVGELRRSVDFVEHHARLIAEDSSLPEEGARPAAGQKRSPQARALADFCAMLLNSNEFVFRF